MATKNISPQFNKPGIYKVINGAPKIATTQEASSPGSSLGYTSGRGLAPGPQSGNGSGVPYVAGPGIIIDRNQIEVNVGTGLKVDSAGQLTNTEEGLPTPSPAGYVLASNGTAWVGEYFAPTLQVSGGLFLGHFVVGSVTASAATTSVTLSGGAVYSTAYGLTVWNYTTHSPSTISAQNLTGFTFNSTTGDVYVYLCFGF